MSNKGLDNKYNKKMVRGSYTQCISIIYILSVQKISPEVLDGNGIFVGKGVVVYFLDWLKLLEPIN